MIRRVWSHKVLILALVRRQFHLRYRQSFVGVVWAVVPPLATLGAGILVFDKVAGIDTGNTSYALFAMSALVPWTLFANSVSLGIPSVSEYLPIIVRLSFPRAVIPLSMVGVSLLDLATSMVIFGVFVVILGETLPLTALWFPALLALEIILVVGLVLLGSAINVFARDVRLAVPLLVQLWLFLTPVMYPLDSVPEGLRILYLANPMTGIVESFRQSLVYGQGPELSLLLPAMIGSVVVFVWGVWYFGTTEHRFADVI